MRVRAQGNIIDKIFIANSHNINLKFKIEKIKKRERKKREKEKNLIASDVVGQQG